MAGTVVIGPGTQLYTRRESTALIYVRQGWSGEWTFVDHAIFDMTAVYAGSDGASRLEFSTPYGTVLSLFTGAFAARDPIDLMGYWVRLVMVDAAGARSTVFVGQVRAEDRAAFGSNSDASGSSTPRPKGWQRWVAFGGQLLLRLRAVSTSWWDRDGVAEEIGWTPGFNERDRRGLLIGNRSADAIDDVYVFGGTETWTRRQAIDYLMALYMAEEEGGAPTWTIGGQVDALDQALEDVPARATQTVEDLLRDLIPRHAGLDFSVVPTLDDEGEPTGFEVRVFALIGTNVSFRGATLPRNPALVTLKGSDMADVDGVNVTRDYTHRAARVRLVGERVVVCATLRGPELAGDPTGDVLTSTPATLRGQWTSTEETAYKRGAAEIAEDDEEAVHDAARRADRFRAVYQRFAAPADWARPAAVVPAIDGQAEVIDGEVANYQDLDRSTLSWLPLREGFDYSTDPATDRNPADAVPEFLAPLVIANDRKAEIERAASLVVNPALAEFLDVRLFAPVDQLGVGVAVLKTDLGVQLSASPNHRLARGRFDPADSGTAASADDPSDDTNEDAIDPRTLAATIAWRSDERLILEAALDADADDGSVIEIEVPDAEMWWLAPGTIVDVDNDGQPVTSGPAGRVLRNDADRLGAFMAGAVARHLHGRARAEVRFRGWVPWISLLGSILLTVEEAGETHGIDSPITCVELHGGKSGSPRTVIRAGYAL